MASQRIFTLPPWKRASTAVALSVVGSVVVAFAASPNWIRIDWPVYWLLGGAIIGLALITPVVLLLVSLGVSPVRVGGWCFAGPAAIAATLIAFLPEPWVGILGAFGAFCASSLGLGVQALAANATPPRATRHA